MSDNPAADAAAVLRDETKVLVGWEGHTVLLRHPTQDELYVGAELYMHMPKRFGTSGRVRITAVLDHHCYRVVLLHSNEPDNSHVFYNGVPRGHLWIII